MKIKIFLILSILFFSKVAAIGQAIKEMANNGTSQGTSSPNIVCGTSVQPLSMAETMRADK